MAKAPSTENDGLTERQKKWFSSVKEGLEKETGKSMAEWVAIARTCPETKSRARTKWLKDKYGIGINRASVIFIEAFDDGPSWDNPAALKDALWKDEVHRQIVDKLQSIIAGFEGVTTGQRKTFTAFSRKVQFAAVRPYKGQVRLGLAVSADSDPLFQQPLKSEGWSDRLTASTMLSTPKDINARLISFLKQAWEAA